MTDNTADKAASPKKSRRPIIGWGLFAFVTLSLAISAAVGAWYVYRDAEKDRTRLLATLDEMTIQLAELEKLKDTQAAIIRGQDDAASALASMASRMEESENETARLGNLVEGGRRHWQVVEIEQLLLIANDRLQLHHDLAGALHALNIANQRLADISEPRLLPTRKILAEEISALKAVPETDIQSMVLQITALITRAGELPLSSDLPRNFENIAVQPDTAPQTTTGWRRFVDKLLVAARGMLQIRQAERPLVPLLPPDQEFFLKQNLILKLETARLSLLQRDTASFRSALDSARGWLKAFYNLSDSRVQSAVEEVTALGRQDLRWAQPDISGSLQALRRYLALSGSNAGTGEPVTQ